MSLGAANRDEARWENPDDFDIFRDRKAHIAFGHGPHTCIGMHLARMETQVAVTGLLDRLPNLRLDPDADPAARDPRGRATVAGSPPRGVRLNARDARAATGTDSIGPGRPRPDPMPPTPAPVLCARLTDRWGRSCAARLYRDVRRAPTYPRRSSR